MLVLSRKLTEEIVIGKQGEIVISVQRVRGNTVHIGISAPKEIPVHRREVYESIQRKKREADSG